MKTKTVIVYSKGEEKNEAFYTKLGKALAGSQIKLDKIQVIVPVIEEGYMP
jgi:hypothetical protein